METNKPKDIQTHLYPTIGNPKSKVNVVVFEEPRCIDCMEYNNQIFPKIKKEFIDNHLISYTAIPLSFLPNSLDTAAALLCVYNQQKYLENAELYFHFLDYIYNEKIAPLLKDIDIDGILQLAKTADNRIDTKKLKECLRTHHFHKQTMKNNDYAEKLMDGHLETPTVFVNGIKIANLNYDTIKKQISHLLESK